MKIGFDLDGVLAEQDICQLQILKCLVGHENYDWALEWYYRDRKPLLDPRTILMNGDEGYIITGRIESRITDYWCDRFCKGLKVFYLKTIIPTGRKTHQEWCDEQARLKGKIINELGIEVYFDDVPFIVDKLRELCPKCKIIHYGHQVYEGLK